MPAPPPYSFVAGSDVSLGAGSFPISLSTSSIPGIQVGDFIMIAAFFNAAYTGSNGWANFNTDCTVSDTLEGMSAITATPFALPTGASGTIMQASALWFWAVGSAGSDVITVNFTPTAGSATYSSAYLSVAVYRSVRFGLFTGQVGSPNALAKVNAALHSLTTTVAAVTVNLTLFGFLPAEMVGVISPGSGTPPAGYTARGTGIFVDKLDTVNSSETMTVTGTATGTLYLMGVYLAAIPQRGNIDYDQIGIDARTGDGTQLLTWNVSKPFGHTDPGVPGQISYDTSGNFYWCYATDLWARIGPGGYSKTF